MSAELKIAKQAAREAGQILMKYFRGIFSVRQKSPDNPVTNADIEADKYLKSQLLGSFPNDGWLSEETKDPESSVRLSKERVWIVDPLDGTKEFIAGRPEFVVSIGLVKNGDPILGVLFNPATDEMFSADEDEPSNLNGRVLAISHAKLLSESTLIVSRTEERNGLWNPYRKYFKNAVVCGSVAYKLASFADGRADAFISLNPKNEWDVCAGDYLIRRAGGIITTRTGKPIVYNQPNPHIPNGIIASLPNLAPALLLRFGR
ncbi:MAG: 3'(2'),5'-bisphosphate nucleotidase CysQ [Candidatus Marinimicrobia bacterium CG08_land_8_20_14_0_20_45_22]|nr:MAG: 3'(2'),5'-bisphosphate nucleotidase CysQ [Candidatus Marinimicrobia bacterium CG08_land_8_20_14_0_20_45_22]